MKFLSMQSIAQYCAALAKTAAKLIKRQESRVTTALSRYNHNNWFLTLSLA